MVQSFPFIVIFPQAANGWWTKAVDQDDAVRELDETLAQYNIDYDRVALLGISTGGYGAWSVGGRYHDRFSAIVTMGAKSSPEMAARLCQALMAHWRLITPRLVTAVTGAGGELYAWTVDRAVGVRGLNTSGGRMIGALVPLPSTTTLFDFDRTCCMVSI